ncbi:uncharacterized protein LOC123666908 [Melitaea cinxia]|uniref:uncharacterized protein LOC123666908 n=1 Tax=Melitaea cinxia TaxID=113334 RepID=UPI001E27209E|nr:uncharacterized protein LOC123666908 [Melitaea cinxia]
MEKLLSLLQRKYPDVYNDLTNEIERDISGSIPDGPASPERDEDRRGNFEMELAASDSDCSISSQESRPASPASSDSDKFEPVLKSRKRKKVKASIKPLPSKRCANTARSEAPAHPTSAAPAAPPATRPTTSASESLSAPSAPSSARAPKKPPPAYIQDKAAWSSISKKMEIKNICPESAKATYQGIRVTVKDSETHRRLTSLLRQEKISFHTYALDDERQQRVVIRGLPSELSTEDIKTDLLCQKYPVKQVSRMYHPRTKAPYPMVLVVLELSPEGKTTSPGLPCVRCLGDHGTTDCPRRVLDPEVPPSCVLCKQDGHPANYRGCPRAPRKRRPRETRGRATSQKRKPTQETTTEVTPAPQEAPKPQQSGIKTQQVVSKATPTHNKAPQAASVAPKANAWNKPLSYVKTIPTRSVVEPTPIKDEVKRMKAYLAEVRTQLDRMAAVLESFDV